jgi:hypothetical protein
MRLNLVIRVLQIDVNRKQQTANFKVSSLQQIFESQVVGPLQMVYSLLY